MWGTLRGDLFIDHAALLWTLKLSVGIRTCNPYSIHIVFKVGRYSRYMDVSVPTYLRVFFNASQNCHFPHARGVQCLTAR